MFAVSIAVLTIVRYKNPTPNPLRAGKEGYDIPYVIRKCYTYSPFPTREGVGG
jgi:hypothetical protein